MKKACFDSFIDLWIYLFVLIYFPFNLLLTTYIFIYVY